MADDTSSAILLPWKTEDTKKAPPSASSAQALKQEDGMDDTGDASMEEDDEALLSIADMLRNNKLSARKTQSIALIESDDTGDESMGEDDEILPSLASMLRKTKPKKDGKDKPKDELVEVLCAGTTEPFPVHRKLLSERSRSLKRHIDREAAKKPGKQVQIRFDCAVNGFEVFKRWLYGGPIYQPDPTLGRVSEIHVLMAAYDLGKMLDNSYFQDTIMDTIIKLLAEHGHDFHIGKLIPQKAKDLPPKTSRLRHLLADWIAYGDINEPQSNEGQLPKDADFSRLVAMVFIKRKVNGAPAAPYVANPCGYHIHLGTKVCAPETAKKSTKY